MGRTAADTVGKKLAEYAERGVFRGFAERPAPSGKAEWTFVWLLNQRFRVVLDTKAGTIQFRDLLPHAPAKSDFDLSIRGFVNSRSDTSLPPHRRVDPKRAELKCLNRGGCISLLLKVKNNQYAYGTGKLLNVTNELFGHISMHFAEYTWEVFNVPAE